MTRVHIHISVDDLEASTKFYSDLFGENPTVSKPNYSKWDLADPALNFAISDMADRSAGLNHVGIQASSAEELNILYKRLSNADYSTLDEQDANCCYARADKHWVVDPSGVVWEMFHTMGEIETYGEDRGATIDPLVK